jgi:hypothetical protein
VWEAEKLRDDIIKAMLSVITASRHHRQSRRQLGGQPQRLQRGNSDRLLFGVASRTIRRPGRPRWATSTPPTTSATMATMSLMKRIAKAADPHIRPFMSKVGQEYFVAFHGSRTFRDLKLDTTLTGRQTATRGPATCRENPIFQDGDLIYDGIIHREVPEIDAIAQNTGGTYSLDAVGAASADVRPVFLCGAQAVGIAWGQEPTPRTDTREGLRVPSGRRDRGAAWRQEAGVQRCPAGHGVRLLLRRRRFLSSDFTRMTREGLP